MTKANKIGDDVFNSQALGHEFSELTRTKVTHLEAKETYKMKLNLSAHSIAGFSTAVLTTALVSYAPSASAAILNGTSGSWSNPQGGSRLFYVNADGFNQIRWGAPAYHSNPTWRDKSGLGFKGVGETEFRPQ